MFWNEQDIGVDVDYTINRYADGPTIIADLHGTNLTITMASEYQDWHPSQIWVSIQNQTNLENLFQSSTFYTGPFNISLSGWTGYVQVFVRANLATLVDNTTKEGFSFLL